MPRKRDVHACEQNQVYNIEPAIPSRAKGCKGKMSKKRNVVLYLDSELVKKSRELGFNLSKTFENHLKQLVNHVDGAYPQNNSSGWWAGPDLNRRPSARQADVLTELDYRPSMFVGYFQYIAFN